MMHREGRARWLLALGAVVGIALAMAGLLAAPEDEALPAGTVTRVNDTFIRSEKFERAVAALASDRRTPLTPADLRAPLQVLAARRHEDGVFRVAGEQALDVALVEEGLEDAVIFAGIRDCHRDVSSSA